MKNIILINGAPGAGKSTIARLVAQQLEASQLIGTDVIREVMRRLDIDKKFTHIHTSSVLLSESGFDSTDHVALFLEQARQVMIGVNSVIERCISEDKSCVIEGIHLVPQLLKGFQHLQIKKFVLYVGDERDHHNRLAKQEAGRAINKVGRFDVIRKIQDFLVNDAKQYGVSCLENIDMRGTVDKILSLY
ncbi:MAG TPA: AAA family ATPase [Candidatus Dojkabacteria bacterium]|nr:AAA family ATPase [Candidatus Dojkabacteria bacterium]HQF36639.1 AAA family ATPase [Candidatus Dojkabacteria bacterium]